LTGVPPYSAGELSPQPGTQARGWCQVGLGPATVSLIDGCRAVHLGMAGKVAS
jgi:hypothetical protein